MIQSVSAGGVGYYLARHKNKQTWTVGDSQMKEGRDPDLSVAKSVAGLNIQKKKSFSVVFLCTLTVPSQLGRNLIM